MDYIGLLAFIMAIGALSAPSEKIKNLKRRVARLEKQLNQEKKGEEDMSKMLEELKGKECTLEVEDGVEITGTVLGVDEEWIKLTHSDKKNNKITELLRTELVTKVTVTEKAESEQD